MSLATTSKIGDRREYWVPVEAGDHEYINDGTKIMVHMNCDVYVVNVDELKLIKYSNREELEWTSVKHKLDTAIPVPIWPRRLWLWITRRSFLPELPKAIATEKAKTS